MILFINEMAHNSSYKTYSYFLREARVLSFLIRYFSNYYTLHRSDLAARAAPRSALDINLEIM